MTRDQAISKVQLACIQGEAQGLIKSLENLGLLKLDEPKSAQKRCDEIFTLYRLEDAKLKAHEFLAYIDEAGLKIIEK